MPEYVSYRFSRRVSFIRRGRGKYGARLVRAYRGSYTNIVGLPEEELRAQLAALGVIG